jgi:hypothetical protein
MQFVQDIRYGPRCYAVAGRMLALGWKTSGPTFRNLDLVRVDEL